MSDNLNEHESVEKDTATSTLSERDTAAKQDSPVESSFTASDPDVDASAISVLPGTGGPDDVGDIEVDPDELNLSGH